MRFVEERHEIFREVIEQCERSRPRFAPVDVPRVILDAAAITKHFHHLEVVKRALLDALRLQKFADRVEILEAFLEFFFDSDNGLVDVFLIGHVMLRAVNHARGQFGQNLAGQKIEHRHALEVIAPKFQAHWMLVVGGPDFNHVTFGPEPSR